MRNEGIGSWPARRARKTPHRTALIHHPDPAVPGGDPGEPVSSTYAELHDRTARLALSLSERGIRRGDRVAYLGPNHPAYLETLFAAGLLGAVFVPLNTRLSGPELAYQLDDSGARLLVHAPAHRDLVDGLETVYGAPYRVELGPAYEELVAGPPPQDGELDEPVTGDDHCLIMYTSGTTGRPKGAVLTHANLTWNAVNVLVDTDLTAGEVALASAPLFHTAGLNMLTLPVLLKGGTCVLTESFAPGATLELIERHRISFVFGVPTMYEMIARQPRWESADLSSLRLLSCGGAPVPEGLIRAYQRRGLTFLQGYGMTEAAPGVLFLDAEHSVSKAGSAGVPHFFSDVRVVREGLTPAAPGETGEVLVRGPHVMPGYWGLPDATAAAFTEGWLRTGDAARTDADGYVTLVDRLKDMIISGGENIYPAEVEAAVLGLPGVAECAVIGVPDARWGQVARAVVVPEEGAAPDAEVLLSSLAGRLAKYKIPKSVVFADALPRTASGKLRKPLLRERYGTP
ncbi:long-chain fatty acid--CoA ligase [Streptomyces sp. ODS28]|uniref:acyl-CoA synthetase n=1 Tax=Streptomyces sp. ODS28 TaxID=3136688 RepID=UPI0031E9155C